MSSIITNGYALYRDDCFNVLPLLDDRSIDLILVDPPYGTTACKWDTVLDLPSLWRHIWRLLKLEGSAIFTASQPFTTTLVSSCRELFKYELIWEKTSATGFLDCKYRPMKSHENILVFSRAGC